MKDEAEGQSRRSSSLRLHPSSLILHPSSLDLLRSRNGEVVIYRGATFSAARVINSLDSPETFAVNLYGFGFALPHPSQGWFVRRRPTSSFATRVLRREHERASAGAGAILESQN
jgi:hypothetical protein